MKVEINTLYNIGNLAYTVDRKLESIDKKDICPICNDSGQLIINNIVLPCKYCGDKIDKPKLEHYEVSKVLKVESINASTYLKYDKDGFVVKITDILYSLKNEDISTVINENDLIFKTEKDAQAYCDKKGKFNPNDELPF